MYSYVGNDYVKMCKTFLMLYLIDCIMKLKIIYWIQSLTRYICTGLGIYAWCPSKETT